MNKFHLNLYKAAALESVASSVQYYMDSCIETINNYKTKAEENEEAHDPESYWMTQAQQEQEKLNLWNEIAQYLEKKLMK